jgi:hypothetical protein
MNKAQRKALAVWIGLAIAIFVACQFVEWIKGVRR